MQRSEPSGLTLSADSPVAAAAVEALEGELLRYGKNAWVILKAIDADPGFALGHALAAALHLFAMSPGATARARPLVARAVGLARSASERERLLIAAIAAWAQGDIGGALARHEVIAERWPQDLLSAKIALYHQLNAGDLAAMLRLTRRLVAANPGRGHVLGMHAFALEQNGDLLAAERVGREAAAAAFDPWAQHAVAHVLDSSDRIAEGAAWMAAHAEGWGACSSFLYTHNWWHAALFHLGLGDDARAMAIFDDHVWAVRKDYCQDQLNAVSLLARLELAGADVGERWAGVADQLAARTRDQVNSLFDLHYVYGLARAGRDAAVHSLLTHLQRRSRGLEPSVWREVTPVAAHALVAHARGRHAAAAGLLRRVRSRLGAVGGSHTQRALFELIYLDSERRAAAPTVAVVADAPRRCVGAC